MNESAPTLEPVALGHLRRVWERMIAMYDHKWVSGRGLTPQKDDGTITITGDVWAKGLAGLTPSHLAAGLRACLLRADPWPPSVQEFRGMCLGIPSLDLVHLEFRGLSERTPFGVLVWNRIDSQRWRMASPETQEKLIAAQYNLAREHVLRGGSLPSLAVAEIEAPKPAPPKHDPEARERAINEIKELFGMSAEDAASSVDAQAVTAPVSPHDGKMAAAGPDA
jgi:hypothetical protein